MKILEFIDKKFEYISLIIISIILPIMFLKNYMSYLFLVVSLIIGIIIFIRFDRSFSIMTLTCTDNTYTIEKSRYFRILLSIIFTLFYGISFLTLLDSPYTKTIWYYLFFSICVYTIIYEILFYETKLIWKINLLKIILLLLNLSFSNQIIYTLQIGNPDNFYHIYSIVVPIVENGVIPKGHVYSTFPIHHILVSMMVLLVNIQPSLIYHYLGAFIMSISPLFVFMIGKLFFDYRFGLMSALLYSSSDYLIFWMTHPVQMTYMYPMILILFTSILYILKNRFGHTPLFIIFSIDIIFLHHYSAMITIFIFFIILLLEYEHKRKMKNCDIKSYRLFQLFLLMLLVHWIYYAKIFGQLVGIVQEYASIFQKDFSENIVGQTYYDTLPVDVLIINEIGSSILIVLSIIGFFYFYKHRTFFGNIISGLFIMFMSLIGIGAFVDVMYLLPNRIYAFMQELSMIFLSSAAILWMINNNRKYTKFFIIFLVVVLQFFSASSTIAGLETSLFTGEQPYRKFYETPQERYSLLWIEAKMTNSSNISLNPGFVYVNISRDETPLVPIKEKVPVKKMKEKVVLDLENISSTQFLFSKFDISVGFEYESMLLKSAHMGSYKRAKLYSDEDEILDTYKPIDKIYDNGILYTYNNNKYKRTYT